MVQKICFEHKLSMMDAKPEIDISVSKLLSFETLACFFRVSVSENLVSENLVSKKSLGFGFRKLDLG